MTCNPQIFLQDVLSNCFRWATGLLFIFPQILPAQVFEAKTDSKEIVLGSTFEVAFTLKDARGEQFKAPAFSDFKLAGGPSEMRGMTIINGRSTSHQTWTYELEPRRVGTFTIGEATILVDGQTLSTKPLTVKVLPARAKPNLNLPPGAADNIFVTGELSSESAWSGEQVNWRIRLYTQLSIEGADLIELPDFQGFYAKEKRRFDTRIEYQTIKGKKYAVKTLHEEALFPQETGELTIGAAKVRVGIEQSGAFGAFLGPKPVILQTQPLRLKVKPLLSPVPDNFSGGVGTYDWALHTDRDSVSTDDALTLTVSIRGNGDAKRFALPKLAVPAGLEVFEPKIKEEEEYENGEEVVHSKVLEYVILPKEPGEYAIAPTLVYFDTDSNRYRTLLADSLPPFQVTAGKNYGVSQPGIDTLPLPPPAVLPETKIWDTAMEWIQSPMLWGILASPLLIYGLFLFLKKQKKAPTVVQNIPTRPPAKTARDRFANAARLVNSGNPRAFYDEVFKALLGYLSARLNLPPAQMTQENVRKMLTERGVPSGTIQNLLSVWQTCEQALFAGQTQSAQMDNTWRAAESVVQDLEKAYRR